MTIGTGIALAAIWGFAAASMFAPEVGGAGMIIAIVAAVFATAIIVAARK